MTKETYIISNNLNRAYGRIVSALQTEATNEVKSVLLSLPDRVLTVGTGGSYAAALFAAKCINTYETGFAESVKPRDALLFPLDKYGLVLLFSYSGLTNDIQAVYRACCEKHIPVRVITALDKNDANCPYKRDEMISYTNDNPDFEERGFISMASTLIPMSLFAARYYDGKVGFEKFLYGVFSQREKDFEFSVLTARKTALIIDIFSAYDTATASTILESDIIESGIGRVTVHEKKDFSHGRYNAIESLPPDIVVFFDSKVGSYTNKLKVYLSQRVKFPLIEMKARNEGFWGDFDLAVAVQFFVAKLSEEAGYDMSDPTYPEEAKGLYKYSGDDIL